MPAHRLFRLTAPYEADGDGRLLRVGDATALEPAAREGELYRALAELADAPVEAIVHAASTYGPLGPVDSVPEGQEEREIIGRLDGGLGLIPSELDELRHWVAAGGRTTFAIPWRLAPTAALLGAFAAWPSPLREVLFATASGDAALIQPVLRGSPHQQDPLSEFMGAYAGLILSATHVPGGAEPMVRLGVHPSTLREDLIAAGQFLREVVKDLAIHGGTSAALDHGALPRMNTFLGGYLPAECLPQPIETVQVWRQAAEEFRAWVQVVRGLRAIRRVAKPHASYPAALSKLSTLAGRQPFDSPSTDPTLARLEASSLLAARLQQLAAWPMPAGKMVGAHVRGLWSAWEPVAGSKPPRGCRWPGGCSALLPADAHGGQAYCEWHKRESARLRAARNRQRRT